MEFIKEEKCENKKIKRKGGRQETRNKVDEYVRESFAT